MFTRGITHKASTLVRLMSSTGQTGQAGMLRMNSTRGSTPPNPSPDLPNRSTVLNKTCQNERNRRNSTKNASNPRAKKTPKSSPFAHGFGRGIKGKRTTKGSSIHLPPNPKEKGLEIALRKLPRKLSINQQK
jgi:hypothetical protein